MRTQVCFPNLMYKNWAQWNVFIIAHLARQRQVDPWNLLTSPPSLTSEFQDTERPCVQKQDQWFLRNNTGSWPIASIVYLHTYMCTTAHVPVTFTWAFTPHTHPFLKWGDLVHRGRERNRFLPPSSCSPAVSAMTGPCRLPWKFFSPSLALSF